MALSDPITIGGDPIQQAVGSMQSEWVTAHDNANVAAGSADNPSEIAQAGAKWIRLSHPATKVLLRLKHTANDATTTAPVVKIWAASGRITSAGVPADYGQVEVIGSVTLDTTATHEDAAGDFDFCGTSAAQDLNGASAFLLEVTTQGVGSAAASIQAKALN